MCQVTLLPLLAIRLRQSDRRRDRHILRLSRSIAETCLFEELLQVWGLVNANHVTRPLNDETETMEKFAAIVGNF